MLLLSLLPQCWGSKLLPPSQPLFRNSGNPVQFLMLVRQALYKVSHFPSSIIWFFLKNWKLCITVNMRSVLFNWVCLISSYHWAPVLVFYSHWPLYTYCLCLFLILSSFVWEPECSDSGGRMDLSNVTTFHIMEVSWDMSRFRQGRSLFNSKRPSLRKEHIKWVVKNCIQKWMFILNWKRYHNSSMEMKKKNQNDNLPRSINLIQ